MPEDPKNKHIAIVGAGLVGSLAAIYLRKRGYQVSVFERRPDLRKSDQKGGRSINLALSNRGWLPLSQVGVLDEVRDMIIPMKGRMMHNLESELTFQPYGLSDQAINSISRTGLNELLINKGEISGVRFNFQYQCIRVDLENTALHFNTPGGPKKRGFDQIIGADGAFSTVRAFMQRSDRFNYSQYYIPHGYKELSIPPGGNDDFLVEKNALHIWPRGNFMLIALPNKDRSFTVTLFLPFEGNNSFEKIRNNNDAEAFFSQQFPDALDLMPNLKKEWNSNPTSSLVTVRSYPWFRGKTLLIGDAAHAIVPFYGQGMNCGFEDCRILDEMMTDCKDNWEEFLPAYQEFRKPDADAIADLALQNFIEMRDLVGNEEFLLRKKIEARIHSLYPDKWLPLYSMVTFNALIRYSEAMQIGQQQNRIMDEVMSRPAISENWESLDFQGLIDALPA